MKIFLRLKAYQMFIILFCVPFILHILLMGLSTSNGSNILLSLGAFVTLISILIYFLWIWTLGIELNKFVDVRIRKKTTLFKLGLLFCVIVSGLFFYEIFQSINQVSSDGTLPFTILIDLIFILVSLYCIYFVAKNLIMAEKQEKDDTNNFIGPFFMIWVFPFGIWKIQPRILKLFQNIKT